MIIPAKHENIQKGSIVLGADASEKINSTALSAAAYNLEGLFPELVRCDIWEPGPDESGEVIVDLSATIGEKIKWYLDNYDVVAILYDPYQLHSLMVDMKKKYDRTGLKKLFVEFPQGAQRVLSDEAFYQWIQDKKLRRVRHEGLRQHVLSATAKSNERGFRIDKGTGYGGNNDAAVSSSMACYGASVRVRAKRKFINVGTAGKEPAKKETG